MSIIKEKYETKIIYSQTTTGDNPVRYVTVVLPDCSDFSPEESVEVSITAYRNETGIYSSPPEKRINANRHGKRKGYVYPAMKNLNVGDEPLVFPYSMWQAARSAASILKKNYGVRYAVTKKAPIGIKGDIYITRLE